MHENLVKILNFAMLLFSFSHEMYEDHKLCKYAIYTEYKQRFIVNFIVINVLTKKAKYHVLVCLDFVLDFFFFGKHEMLSLMINKMLVLLVTAAATVYEEFIVGLGVDEEDTLGESTHIFGVFPSPDMLS